MDINYLWKNWQLGGSVSARNKLVEYYQPWLKKITGYVYKHISGLGLEFSDCLNTANLALIESIERYDKNQNANFETFSSYRIKGSIYNSVSFYAPEINKYLFHKYKEDKENSRSDLLDIGNTEESIEALVTKMLVSELLDSMPTTLEYQQNSMYLNDKDFLLTRKLHMELEMISSEHAMVLRFHHFHAYPLKDIASMIGVSSARASQIHKQALIQLSKRLA